MPTPTAHPMDSSSHPLTCSANAGLERLATQRLTQRSLPDLRELLRSMCGALFPASDHSSLLPTNRTHPRMHPRVWQISGLQAHSVSNIHAARPPNMSTPQLEYFDQQVRNPP